MAAQLSHSSSYLFVHMQRSSLQPSVWFLRPAFAGSTMSAIRGGPSLFFMAICFICIHIYIYVYIKFLNFTAHQYRGLLSPPLGFVLRRIFCSSDFTLLGRILGHLLNILLREAPAHFSLLFSSEFFEPLEGPRDGRCHCLFPCTIHAACQLHAASWNERKSTRVLTSEFLAS